MDGGNGASATIEDRDMKITTADIRFNDLLENGNWKGTAKLLNKKFNAGIDTSDAETGKMDADRFLLDLFCDNMGIDPDEHEATGTAAEALLASAKNFENRLVAEKLA